MRTLKFRARFRKISTGEEIWQFAELYANGIVDPYSFTRHGYTQISPWEQLTDLKDKNQHEIYEGDIIKGVAIARGECAVYSGEQYVFIGEVKWDLEDTGFYFETTLGMWPCIKPWFTEDVEIIGNIHENPGLLNEL